MDEGQRSRAQREPARIITRPGENSEGLVGLSGHEAIAQGQSSEVSRFVHSAEARCAEGPAARIGTGQWRVP